MKLNLACGDRPRAGYINLDVVPGKGDGQADCLHLDDFADGSVEEVLSEHFIEHLSRPELLAFFEQARRLIRPGGFLALRAPCFRCVCSGVACGRLTLEQADLLLFARHLHEHDFHRQGIWEEKFARLCAGFGFSHPEFEHGPDQEISMKATRCRP